MKRRNTIIQENGVGEVQDLGEFGLGIAPKGSKPINKIELSKEKEAEIADAQAYEPYKTSEAPVLLDDETALLDQARQKNKPALKPHVPKQMAFIEFKQLQSGQELETNIRDNREELT